MEAAEEGSLNTTNDQFRSDDFADGYQLYKWIQMIGVIPFCIVGLGTNTVSVWAWNCIKNNFMAILFQYLGVLDNIYLLVALACAILHYIDKLSQIQAFMFPLIYVFQSLSVHLTLIIGAFRWLLVARPLWSRRITQYHMKRVSWGLGAWCVLLTVLLILLEVMFDFSDLRLTVGGIVLMVVGLALPAFVLLVFSVGLFWVICQFDRRNSLSTRSRTARLQSTTESVNMGRMEHPAGNHSENHGDLEQRSSPRRKRRWMTIAVLSIAVCSLVACTVGVAGKILTLLLSHRPETEGISWPDAYIVFGAGDVLQVFNSSVNFFFYLFFASKFRLFVKESLCRMLGRGP